MFGSSDFKTFKSFSERFLTFSHYALQSFQAADLKVSRPNYVYHIFPQFTKIASCTACPLLYVKLPTNCSQPRGFHPRKQRIYTYWLSPPQILTDLVTCTAVAYLSSQSIQFTSLLDTNQEIGVVSHPLTLS